jgi:hypothetical protein
MNDGGSFVRGFGNPADGKGAIAWSLAGGGAVSVEGGTASAAGPDAAGDEPGGGWSFETRLEDDLMEGAAIFRHIAVDAGERGTIVCTAVGAEGISGHAEERTQGVLRSGGDEIPYDEALISTQYDGAGDPTRFGLELWPPDADQTTRAAATRVSASLLGGARNGATWAGLFRCHTDGVEGIGTYLLSRA